ncbi:MAG: lactate utilization protein [Pelovirga sp.]
MKGQAYLQSFIEASRRVGADVVELKNLDEAAAYVAAKAPGRTLIPATPLARRWKLTQLMLQAGVEVFDGDFRTAGQMPGAGVTFCNFALADTGTVVLESTAEETRLATTLPEMHFVIVDPDKVLKDNLAAAAPMMTLHAGSEPRFIAYISGPSRTADIERVLTIGCHGPRELHILVIPSVSSDLMEI